MPKTVIGECLASDHTASCASFGAKEVAAVVPTAEVPTRMTKRMKDPPAEVLTIRVVTFFFK